MTALFRPAFLAIAQLDDRVFLGVMLRGVAAAFAGLLALHVFAAWAVGSLLSVQGPLAWLAHAIGSLAATAIALWLFLPLAALVASLFLDRIAAAVEHRHYPHLPPPVGGASIAAQIWYAIALGLRILGLNIVALILATIFPGPGWLAGWAIAAYGIGRGLFMAVAMRRMTRRAAESVYKQGRWSVLAQGALLALTSAIPLANLLTPVLGVAAMVHVLDRAVSAMPRHSDDRAIGYDKAA